jgi:hypothetical protein
MAGGMTLAGGVPVNLLARWNATDGWSDMAGGASESVAALGVFKGEIQVGLTLTIGREAEPSPGGEAARGAGPPGYGGLYYSWRKDGFALENGPTDSGSIISGADTATLTITQADISDQGGYDCVVYSACGSTISITRGLTLNGCPGDCDGDGDVDADDYPDFESCFHGPDDSGCACADFDDDGDTDLLDYAEFQVWFEATRG